MLKKGRNPRVSAQMTDHDVLEELQRILGGHIYAASPPARAHYKPCWLWVTTAEADSVRVMQVMRPYMCQRRRDAIDRCLAKYEEKQTEVLAAQHQRHERNLLLRSLVDSGMTIAAAARQLSISRQTASGIINSPV